MGTVAKRLVAACLATAFTPSALARVHTVKRGETLSGIVYENVSRKVYGPFGGLRRVLELNPEITDPNVIEPGQQIRLEGAPPVAATSPDVDPAAAPPTQEPFEEAVDAPRAAEAPEERPETARRRAVVGVSALVFDTRIDSRASDGAYAADAQSRIQLGARVFWEQPVTEALAIALHGDLRQADFERSEDGRRGALRKGLKGAGARVDYAATARLDLGVTASIAEQPFLRRTDATTLAWDDVWVDEYGARMAYRVLDGGTWSLGLAGRAAYAMGSQGEGFEVKAGTRYGASLEGRIATGERVELRLEAFYDRRAQDTNQARQRNDDAGIALGLGYALGD